MSNGRPKNYEPTYCVKDEMGKNGMSAEMTANRRERLSAVLFPSFNWCMTYNDYKIIVLYIIQL